ncbi:serine/threonine-protein kinase [Gemmata sp. JC717]|uniref:serine/threonine-protein kinase n=1 Tax=Gemmata algarum TaxID=2975278 RepID=UPI0021BB5C19|nr:serine/threonine-protein kinase [Gemmata algarum]MDY3551692.1 serine/threonine-protein kinase [Gemmata algarum]
MSGLALMDSSDSLKLDENLARFLAAYDQELDGGDGRAPTLQVQFPPLSDPALTPERPVTPLPPGAAHEGAMSEVLPDAGRPLHLPPPLGGGHRIGRFELRRQLGKGGCGIVFLAYDPRMLREVALKVPRPEMLMNPDAKRRLKLEALAASEFDHPNLVPVYEWGEVGPLCFIATAFCPGQTLAEWLDRQAFPVPVRQAARLVATVADAVQHAHDRGVLHRDLKPNNVLLQETTVEEGDEQPAGGVPLRGSCYIPRVVDFGLAKVAERGGPSETGTRQILGTPKYMAPEQAQARREDIGPPADVYALGVVLYELLAGRAPYDGATDVEVLRQSVEGRPVAPRQLRPDLPRDLEAICLKAMACTVGERYRTAIDLADDLRRFLDGRPTVARPLAWSGRAGRWLRRNDQLVAIAVLAAIALFVTSLGTWNSYKTRNLQTDNNKLKDYQAERNRVDQQREYARQVRDGYYAWRGGNTQAAAEALDSARRASDLVMDAPEFAHDHLVRLTRTGQLVVVCPAGAVAALAVSPDGTRLASGHADGTLAVWDRATGTQLGTLKAHEGEVSRVAFVRDGAQVVTSGPVPNGLTGMLAWAVGRSGSLAPTGTGVLGVGFAGGGLIAAPPWPFWVRPAGRGAVLAVAPDGRTARSPRPGWVELPSGAVIATDDTGDVRAGAFAPDGATLFTAGTDGIIRSWDVNRAPWDRGATPSDTPVAVAVSSDGAVRVVAGGARVTRYENGHAPAGAPVLERPVAAVRVYHDGRTGFVSFDGATVQVADLSGTAVTERLRAKVPGGRLPVSAALTPDGGSVAVADDAGGVTVWSVAGRSAAGRYDTGLRRLGAVALSDDGKVVAARGPNGVLVWTVGTPETRAVIAVDDQAVFRFLPTGDRLAAAGRDGVVRVFNAAGREEHALFGHVGRVTALGVSPDGRTLVSGGSTGEVRFWDLKAGVELYSARRHPSAVTAIEFSADGKFMLTGAEGQLAAWDTR